MHLRKLKVQTFIVLVEKESTHQVVFDNSKKSTARIEIKNDFESKSFNLKHEKPNYFQKYACAHFQVFDIQKSAASPIQ